MGKRSVGIRSTALGLIADTIAVATDDWIGSRTAMALPRNRSSNTSESRHVGNHATLRWLDKSRTVSQRQHFGGLPQRAV